MTLGEISQQILNENTIPRQEALKQGAPIGAGTPNPNCYHTGEYMPEETREHSTGAVRSSDADNVSYHLISPIGMRRLAMTCREGEEKYSAFNWEKGFPINDLLNHAIAHIYKFLEGNREEDHLAHAAWNLFAAMHSEEQWPELNIGTLRDGLGNPPEPDMYNLSWEVDECVENMYKILSLAEQEQEDDTVQES